jgi:hypothetical protein
MYTSTSQMLASLSAANQIFSCCYHIPSTELIWKDWHPRLEEQLVNAELLKTTCYNHCTIRNYGGIWEEAM